MAHHTSSIVAPAPIELAPRIAANLSTDNFTIFNIETGKRIRSGYAFALEADPVYKARVATEHEITIAVGLARREGATFMAVCPRFDNSFDFVSVEPTNRREEAIEATFSIGYPAYFNATNNSTTTIRHNFAEE